MTLNWIGPFLRPDLVTIFLHDLSLLRIGVGIALLPILAVVVWARIDVSTVWFSPIFSAVNALRLCLTIYVVVRDDPRTRPSNSALLHSDSAKQF